MKYFVTILLLSIVLACSKPTSPIAKTDYYYFLKGNENIQHEDSADTNSKIIFKSYYGEYNFILAGDTEIYYYTRFPKGWICGTGRDFTKPDFICLMPDSIHKIDICSLDLILSKVLSKWKDYGRYDVIISIASTVDTIRNDGYVVIKNQIENATLKGARIIWCQRKPTEQERITLDYKIKNKPFNIDSIQWKEEFSTPLPPPVKQGFKLTHP